MYTGLCPPSAGDLMGALEFPSLQSHTFHCGCCARWIRSIRGGLIHVFVFVCWIKLSKFDMKIGLSRILQWDYFLWQTIVCATLWDPFFFKVYLLFLWGPACPVLSLHGYKQICVSMFWNVTAATTPKCTNSPTHSHSKLCVLFHSALLGFLLLLATVKLKSGLSLEHFAVWIFLSKVIVFLSYLLFHIEAWNNLKHGAHIETHTQQS